MNNKDLRRKIVDIVYKGKDGHIPSAFSIIDILNVLYGSVLTFDAKRPEWEDRDYFILSKGHGCIALYTILNKHGFISQDDLNLFCRPGGILGEHPDCTRVPGVEASTGSLGHGLSYAIGIALGLRLKNKNNKIYVLVGDGESHEGTVWEAANVANNMELGNLCVIVDWNGSAAQLMPKDDLPAKWQAFGWNTHVVDGHSDQALQDAFKRLALQPIGRPNVIVAKTLKGKGVPMVEGHGKWHHRIPNEEELKIIMDALS